MADTEGATVPTLLRVTCPNCEAARHFGISGVDTGRFAARYDCPDDGCACSLTMRFEPEGEA